MRITYGEHPSQFGELSVPDLVRPAPVVVILHGGYWRSGYGLELGRPLADDLVARGKAAFNVEYRRVGDGGGWPQTGDDVAAAMDVLAGHTELDLGRVVALGHSAGGQLAAWLASRRDAAVPLIGAVLQAGVLDLVQADGDGLGGGAVSAFLGGSSEQIPEAYAAASPTALAPLGVPTVCVHGTADTIVPLDQSRRFVERSGGTAQLRTFDGDHFDPITVGTTAWGMCVESVTQLLE